LKQKRIVTLIPGGTDPWISPRRQTSQRRHYVNQYFAAASLF